MDTTATPDRADGKAPDSDMIYEYGVTDALADAIIKTPVVYQPDIKTVQLTYTDARTGEKRKVEEIDWDEVDRLGLNATQWVTDDEPMRQQMAIALRRLEEQERRGKGRYQPILFVVAVCKADAQKAEQTLSKYFKIKTLLVTEDSDEVDRQKARELGKQQKTATPYKAVVSVLMLREGWDVPEVGVILLLRKFGSKVDVGDVPPPPKPLENWKEALDGIEYELTAIEITKIGMAGLVGQELGGKGWKTIHSAPEEGAAVETATQVSDDAVRNSVKEQLLEMAETLMIEAGYAATYKDRVYNALLHHVRARFLDGSSLGLASRQEVEFAWKMLRQVKTKVAAVPGLVAGIIEYGD